MEHVYFGRIKGDILSFHKGQYVRVAQQPDERGIVKVQSYGANASKAEVHVDNVVWHKVVNGVYYDPATDDEVIRILEDCRLYGTRIHLFYGETEAGQDKPLGKEWGEENDVVGCIGCSSGPCHIPLLIQNSRSMGGSHILTECIVRITSHNNNRMPHHPNEMYRHPQYTPIIWEIKAPNAEDQKMGYVTAVYGDGVNHAQFKKAGQAERWIGFMAGVRGCK